MSLRSSFVNQNYTKLQELPIQYDSFQTKLNVGDDEIYGKPDSVSIYATLARMPGDEPRRSLINADEATTNTIFQLQNLAAVMPLDVPILFSDQSEQPENFYYIKPEAIGDGTVKASYIPSEYRRFDRRNVPAVTAWTGNSSFPFTSTTPHTIIYIMPRNFTQTSEFSGYFNINGAKLHIYSNHLLYGQYNDVTINAPLSISQIHTVLSKLQYFCVHQIGSSIYAYDQTTTAMITL